MNRFSWVAQLTLSCTYGLDTALVPVILLLCCGRRRCPMEMVCCPTLQTQLLSIPPVLHCSLYLYSFLGLFVVWFTAYSTFWVPFWVQILPTTFYPTHTCQHTGKTASLPASPPSPASTLHTALAHCTLLPPSHLYLPHTYATTPRSSIVAC